jgi:putative RNA 2'-phosphotransferase
MNEQKKKSIGKFISLILRHEPQKIGLELDNAGWVSVDDLLAGLAGKGKGISFTQLEEIVETNDKKRYCFNDDKTKIRANQGHSLQVDLALEAVQPPEILYHGTASRFIPSIQKEGLQKRNRHHVHLSAEKETAVNVGKRHGKPVVLLIAAGMMYQNGYTFYCSDNGVWLTDHVPPEYFT